jgi:hypothetical protein
MRPGILETGHVGMVMETAKTGDLVVLFDGVWGTTCVEGAGEGFFHDFGPGLYSWRNGGGVYGEKSAEEELHIDLETPLQKTNKLTRGNDCWWIRSARLRSEAPDCRIPSILQ